MGSSRLLKQRDIDRAEKCIECASYDMKADLRTRKRLGVSRCEAAKCGLRLLIMACARNSMEKGSSAKLELKVPEVAK